MSTHITEVPTEDNAVPADSKTKLFRTDSESVTKTRTVRTKPHPRWLLSIEAKIWRYLMSIGLYLNKLPSPASMLPSFKRQFQTTTIIGSTTESAILDLYFYVPKDYESQKSKGKKYPVVVNFHGGGFTMGQATDDGRWAGHVLKDVDAIVVSVEYRLAPEYPFPIAVEDGVEALLHLAANASIYGIDHTKIALSGFSAGGNLSVSIPLRLHTHIQSIKNEAQSKAMDGVSDHTPPLPQIVALTSFYPPLDNRITRDDRRATCARPDKTLPPFLTNLFDESYFLATSDPRSPYASPAAASDEALKQALPEHVALYLCEWDMLVREGEEFAERIKGLEKRVHEVLIKERRHGFDKNPYPFGLVPEVLIYYADACGFLRKAFGVGKGEGP